MRRCSSRTPPLLPSRWGGAARRRRHAFRLLGAGRTCPNPTADPSLPFSYSARPRRSTLAPSTPSGGCAAYPRRPTTEHRPRPDLAPRHRTLRPPGVRARRPDAASAVFSPPLFRCARSASHSLSPRTPAPPPARRRGRRRRGRRRGAPPPTTADAPGGRISRLDAEERSVRWAGAPRVAEDRSPSLPLSDSPPPPAAALVAAAVHHLRLAAARRARRAPAASAGTSIDRGYPHAPSPPARQAGSNDGVSLKGRPSAHRHAARRARSARRRFPRPRI